MYGPGAGDTSLLTHAEIAAACKLREADPAAADRLQAEDAEQCGRVYKGVTGLSPLMALADTGFDMHRDTPVDGMHVFKNVAGSSVVAMLTGKRRRPDANTEGIKLPELRLDLQGSDLAATLLPQAEREFAAAKTAKGNSARSNARKQRDKGKATGKGKGKAKANPTEGSGDSSKDDSDVADDAVPTAAASKLLATKLKELEKLRAAYVKGFRHADPRELRWPMTQTEQDKCDAAYVGLNSSSSIANRNKRPFKKSGIVLTSLYMTLCDFV